MMANKSPALNVHDVLPSKRVVSKKTPSPYDYQLTTNQVDVGELPSYRPTSFTYEFEGHPIWLFSLELRYVKELNFPHVDTFDDLFQLDELVTFKHFYTKLIEQFKPVINFGSSSSSYYDMLLLSGSKTFLSYHRPTHKANHALRLVNHACRIRNSTSNPKYYPIIHARLGGATNFRGCYSISTNLIQPKLSNVTRTIKSYMDFGLKTYKRCPNSAFLQSSQLLPIHDINYFIQMDNEFKKSGVVYRRLQISELAYIFGLPQQFHYLASHKLLQQIIPVQVGDSLLHANLTSNHIMCLSNSMITLPQVILDDRGVFIPAISKWLPHRWFSKSTDDAVAKNDDSEIPIQFWNGRITTVLPQLHNKFCNQLRSIVHKTVCINMRHTFKHLNCKSPNNLYLFCCLFFLIFTLRFIFD